MLHSANEEAAGTQVGVGGGCRHNPVPLSVRLPASSLLLFVPERLSRSSKERGNETNNGIYTITHFCSCLLLPYRSPSPF